MTRAIRLLFPLLPALAALSCLSPGAGRAADAAPGVATGAAGVAPVLILCDRLFDGVSSRVTGPTQVLVRDGRIAEVGPAIQAPPGAERIDLSGMTVMPGLIDAHTHLSFLWSDTTRAPTA